MKVYRTNKASIIKQMTARQQKAQPLIKQTPIKMDLR